MAIIDENGQELPPGQVGDIAVHKDAPALFKGYFRDPERTAKAFRGDWYITGDQARMDEDGYFWFEGRADDIIISSGYTIGPFEVEDALVKHPSVRECAVVASPDPVRGSIVKAFVVLKRPEEASEELVKRLQEHVKSVTAPYKYPREIESCHGAAQDHQRKSAAWSFACWRNRGSKTFLESADPLRYNRGGRGRSSCECFPTATWSIFKLLSVRCLPPIWSACSIARSRGVGTDGNDRRG